MLKRLRDAAEVRFVQLDPGKFAYEWERPPKSQAMNESALARFEKATGGGRRKRTGK